jgi:hypothetical protein
MYYDFHFEQHLTVVAITGVSDWARDFGQDFPAISNRQACHLSNGTLSASRSCGTNRRDACLEASIAKESAAFYRSSGSL